MSNKSGTGGRRYFLLSTHNTHTRFSQAFKLHSVEKNTSKFQAHIILAISEFVPIYSFIHTSDPFLNWQFDIPYWRESRPFPELILHSTELRLKGIWKKPSIALSKIFLKQVPSSLMPFGEFMKSLNQVAFWWSLGNVEYVWWCIIRGCDKVNEGSHPCRRQATSNTYSRWILTTQFTLYHNYKPFQKVVWVLFLLDALLYYNMYV